MNKLIIILVLTIFTFSLVSAGVGISWNKESSLVKENSKTCMTYKVYNPWPDDAYIQITLSQQLMPLVSSMSNEVTFIPKQTSSANAIPVEFCFRTPQIYTQDCLIGDKLLCKQECTEEQKVYEGEVIVSEVKNPTAPEGSGGSSTTMSISAPLRIRLQCIPHPTNYSLIYIVVAVIAGILLTINLVRRKKKKK